MNSVDRLFDRWAINGRAELMEKEHRRPVKIFLDKVKLKNSFTFLDIGCGNGWVVRIIASQKQCKKAVGIDVSKKMIKNALKEKKLEKEEYVVANIEKWKTRKKFDYIFAMESMYYTESLRHALKKIHQLLKPQGIFLLWN